MSTNTTISGFGKPPLTVPRVYTMEQPLEPSSLSFLLNSDGGPVSLNRTHLEQLFVNSTLFERILLDFEQPLRDKFPDSPLNRYCACAMYIYIYIYIYICIYTYIYTYILSKDNEIFVICM